MELGLPRSRQPPRPQHAPRARRGGPACPRPRPGGSKLQILLQATRSLLLTCDRLCIVSTPLPSRPVRPDARTSSLARRLPAATPGGVVSDRRHPRLQTGRGLAPARPSGSALCRARAPRAALDGDEVGSGVCVTWLLWHITDTRFGETHSGRSACVCVAPFRGFLDGAPCSAAPCFVMVTVKSPLREDPGSMREPGPPAAPLEVRTERVFRPPAGLRGPEAESLPRTPRGCAAASEETGKQQAV